MVKRTRRPQLRQTQELIEGVIDRRSKAATQAHVLAAHLGEAAKVAARLAQAVTDHVEWMEGEARAWLRHQYQQRAEADAKKAARVLRKRKD